MPETRRSTTAHQSTGHLPAGADVLLFIVPPRGKKVTVEIGNGAAGQRTLRGSSGLLDCAASATLCFSTGSYTFAIYFSARNGGEALKGEHPFAVLAQEE